MFSKARTSGSTSNQGKTADSLATAGYEDEIPIVEEVVSAASSESLAQKIVFDDSEPLR